jgi:hypothetical protein
MTPARPEIRRSISLPGERLNTRNTPQARARRIKMGKIVVSQNVTLDGVVEDPSG